MGSHNEYDFNGHARIQCILCKSWFHQLASHLGRKHNTTVETYREQFPGNPTMSAWASKHLGEEVSKGKTGKPSRKLKSEATKQTPLPLNDKDDKSHIPIGPCRLKILDPKELDDEDRNLIPQHDPNYYLDAALLEDVAVGLDTDVNVLLVGPNGVGKTTIIRELCALLNRPCKRISLNTETRAADFVGSKKVVIDRRTRQNKIVWQDGILTRGVRRGWVVILDELDLCPPGILARLQEVLEADHNLTLPEHNGEVVKAHPDFRIFATANTVGRGDTTGLYPNRKVLDEATLDRFGLVRALTYLEPKEEAKVVKGKTGVDSHTAKLMVDVAGKVRDALLRDNVRCSFSTRRLLMWGTLAAKLGGKVRKAAELAVLHRLVKDDRDFVKGVVDRVFPTDP